MQVVHTLREVEKVAALAGVMLRTGCFCNPGACAAHLGLSSEDLVANFKAGHVCWDDQDLMDGRPTGGACLLLLSAPNPDEERHTYRRLCCVMLY